MVILQYDGCVRIEEAQLVQRVGREAGADVNERLIGRARERRTRANDILIGDPASDIGLIEPYLDDVRKTA